MRLTEFIEQNAHSMNEIEQCFVEDIFYPFAGENGLDYLKCQTPFEDSECRTRKLDFTVTTNRYNYVFEIDGYTYHAEGAQRVTPEYFDDLLLKQNDLILNGYKLIRFSYNLIRNNPEACINTLRRTFKSDAQINPYYLNSDGFKPTYPQQKALDNIAFYRSSGTNKGVVILPTGMGKTVLAALDAKRVNGKTLFIVHKNEILREAYDKFQEIWPSAKMGFFNATEKDTTSQVIFASKDTLYLDGNIDKFQPDSFDYIIIDEVHHSSCVTYQRIINYFNPKYMVGLTATPERQDRADILELFDYTIYYEMPQKSAIEEGYLSGFKYYGLKDDIDYSTIKYNGNRYDVADLGRKLNIPKRNEAILNKYLEYAKNKKAIGFCVNIDHAETMAEYFKAHGISAAAVHSDKKRLSPEQRNAFIQDFRDNALQILFTVDLFNEGVDFPDVEALLFLRPTESKTIFIQQLGRGLRLSPNKDHVIVLDFIGNFKKAENIKQYIKGNSSFTTDKDISGQKHFGVKEYLDWPLGCDVHFEESVEEIFKANEEANRVISDDELKDNYFAVKETLRHKPKPDDMNNKDVSKFKLSLYRAHYGTWNKFLELIGEATKASYHYPQGTHLGHIFYIVKTLGDKNENDDHVNSELYISNVGKSKFARQLRYKIWASMELGFLYDDRNPDGEDVTDTFKNLTSEGKILYNILCKYVQDDDFYDFKTGGKTEISWQMIHNEEYFNQFILNLPNQERTQLNQIIFRMDAVQQMLIYLFHENKNIVAFNKETLYKNFFNSPIVREYHEMNGIEIPSLSGAQHRIPFILNLLTAAGVIQNSGHSNFIINKLPLVDVLFVTKNFSAEENIKVVKEYYSTGSLPQKDQLTDLKLAFGGDFMTPNYHHKI